MRYLQLEAAAHYGTTIDEFVRRPSVRQAEMIAHLLVKGVREEYAAERMKAASETKRRKSGGFDPMAAQKRAWRLPGG